MLNPLPPPDETTTSDARNDLPPARSSAWSAFWLAGKTLLSGALAVAIIGGAIFAQRQLIATGPEVPQRPAREQVFPVLTTFADISVHRPSIQAFGEVTAGRIVDLRALVAGEITAVGDGLQAGGRVEAGETLVEIDRFAYEGALVEAQANLAEAQARIAESEARLSQQADQIEFAGEQVALAQRDLERARQLTETGALTDRDLDNRQLTVSQRLQTLESGQSSLAIEAARLDQQRAQLARLAWRVEQAERDLERTVLTSPFTGVVRSETVEPGRLVGVNDVVATLYDDSALEVRFNLSDSQFARLVAEEEPLLGRPVTVIWNPGGSDARLSGVIDRLGAEIAATTGGVTVFARLESEGAASLRPGAFVTLELDDRVFEATARLPEAALYNGNRVFLVEDDRLVGRDVTVAAWDGDHVLVRGLEDGAEVITSRLTEAGDGVLIRRIDASGARPASAAAPRTATQGG